MSNPEPVAKIIPFRRPADPNGLVVSSPEVAHHWFAQMRAQLDAIEPRSTANRPPRGAWPVDETAFEPEPEQPEEPEPRPAKENTSL